ncbi:TPA: hypothetical protein HA246_01160 [Candidatus Woesearchaeota archaeon]|nr:hypothetical protein [Candidatus Woesearchaeota archaeon]
MAQRLDKEKIHEFFSLLDTEIDKEIEQPSVKFVLIAVGGTSLTLRNIKPSTKDVDFMVSEIEVSRIKKYSLKISEKNKIKIDLWQSPHIFSTSLLNDYTCELYPKKYKHFDVKLINLIDNAVSKLARFNEADREDIDSILKTGIKTSNIVERFNATLAHDGFANKEDAARNLEMFKKLYDA